MRRGKQQRLGTKCIPQDSAAVIGGELTVDLGDRVPYPAARPAAPAGSAADVRQTAAAGGIPPAGN